MEMSPSLEEKVRQYKPDVQKLVPYLRTPLLLVAGISGAGKNTIIEQLLGQQPDSYMPFVTHTTRLPRTNHGVLEQNGIDYYFIDFATSEKMLDDHAYIEVNKYSGNIYGASVTEIARAQEQHKIVVADIDVNGIANFVALGMNVKPVFIVPPNFEIWQERVHKRRSGVAHDEDWKRRMRTAHDEIAHALEADYFYFVVNEDLQNSVETVNAAAHDQLTEKRPKNALDAAQSILSGIETELGL